MNSKVLATAICLTLAVGLEARDLSSGYVVTMSANKAGNYSTDWHTDVSIFNPHDYKLPMVIQFLATGQDNSAGVPTIDNFDVFPGETLNLWDILGENGFKKRGKTGALLVYADDLRMTCQTHSCDFALFSRTYTLDPYGGAGEFGQAVPGFPLNLGMDRSVITYLPQLLDDANFRTNVGVVSYSSRFVKVHFVLLDAAGKTTDQWDKLVPPFGHLQWRLSRSVTGGTCMAYVVDGPSDALVYPYASIANNVSGDAVYVEAQMTPVGIGSTTVSQLLVPAQNEENAGRSQIYSRIARPERIPVTGFVLSDLTRPRN